MMKRYTAALLNPLILGIQEPAINDYRFTLSAQRKGEGVNKVILVCVQAHRVQLGGQAPEEQNIEIIPILSTELITGLEQHSLSDAMILRLCERVSPENLHDAIVTEIVAQQARLTLSYFNKDGDAPHVWITLSIGIRHHTVLLSYNAKHSRFFVT